MAGPPHLVYLPEGRKGELEEWRKRSRRRRAAVAVAVVVAVSKGGKEGGPRVRRGEE